MAYIRHRPRMVRQSVFADLRATLIAFQWMPDPANPEQPTMGLLGGYPLNLIDYFPEREQIQGEALPVNTLAIDVGRAGQLLEWELGGVLMYQEYTFNMAFYGASDAVAMAIMSDLHDRYVGLTSDGNIPLYNYVTTPPTEVVRMGVDGFRYERDAENIAPHERFLYFAELAITDYVER